MTSERAGGVTSPAKTAKLVELIVDGLSVSEAAKEIGVSRRHAYRLVSDPEAKAAIQRAARESAASAQLVLQRGAEEAARALLQMGTGKVKATPARVAACRGVLDYVVEKAAATLNLNAARADLAVGQPDAARARLEALIAAAATGQRDEQSGASAAVAGQSGKEIRAIEAAPDEPPIAGVHGEATGQPAQPNALPPGAVVVGRDAGGSPIVDLPDDAPAPDGWEPLP